MQEPPALKSLTNMKIKKPCREAKLSLDYICHNHAVKRYVKLITESSAPVTGFERRYGHIEQKIKKTYHSIQHKEAVQCLEHFMIWLRKSLLLKQKNLVNTSTINKTSCHVQSSYCLLKRNYGMLK